VNALEIEGVALSFGPTDVLTDVNLSVPAMSITAVLGSSGSGKTTLLRVIAGFERPRTGRVTLGGQIVTAPHQYVPPERRNVGYVAQEGALFPHLTVAGNVAFGLARSARRGARVGELLDLVGLAQLRRRYPHELSGGQQQRVALARALAREPSVVLLDEPFSSLDAALRASVRDEIAEVLRAAKATVVLVTHDQQEALSIADQVAVLRRGQVAQIGRPREVYARPVDAELAAFVGDANLLEADVSNGVAVTPLGSVRVDGSPNGPATVLIRPEQITLTWGEDGVGLAGRIADQSYHGHDGVVSVIPDRDCGVALIKVRLLGGVATEVGRAVTLTVSDAGEPTAAWPRRS
jgi:iron(III) transport system ATP-binding protein